MSGFYASGRRRREPWPSVVYLAVGAVSLGPACFNVWNFCCESALPTLNGGHEGNANTVHEVWCVFCHCCSLLLVAPGTMLA